MDDISLADVDDIHSVLLVSDSLLFTLTGVFLSFRMAQRSVRFQRMCDGVAAAKRGTSGFADFEVTASLREKAAEIVVAARNRSPKE